MDDELMFATVQIYCAMITSPAYDHVEEYDLMNMAVRNARILLAKVESEGEELS